MEWNSIEQNRIEFNEMGWNGIVQNSIELYRRKWCKIIQNHGNVSELSHRIEENLSEKDKIQERECK